MMNSMKFKKKCEVLVMASWSFEAAVGLSVKVGVLRAHLGTPLFPHDWSGHGPPHFQPPSLSLPHFLLLRASKLFTFLHHLYKGISGSSSTIILSTSMA
jgi:hypothetical protein